MSGNPLKDISHENFATERNSGDPHKLFSPAEKISRLDSSLSHLRAEHFLVIQKDLHQ